MARRQKLGDARKLMAGLRWRAGYVLGTPIPAEYDPELRATIKRVRRHTLSSAARVAALCDSVSYIVENDIDGDIVECGVWKGGSMMAAALTLLRLGDTSRDLYLFDTFSGMAQPGEHDTPSAYDGYSPQRRWRRNRERSGIDDGGSGWAAVGERQVRAAMDSTGYPPERVHLIKGKVQDTVPDAAPEQLAVLRLDTDWYASTKHELEQLYPRLNESGVLIIDDYGHYEGARRAVDEFVETTDHPLLLNRIDYTGRVAVKQGARVTA